ncbi:MAG: hypothetical protein NVSMB13_11910 [Mycobacteriales bacterium]
MTRRRILPLAASALSAGVAAVALAAAPAGAAGPPAAATAFSTAVIGPAGGSLTGFGVTAAFAPGALSTNRLIILGNWPNGLDVPPPNGEKAVKTFGLQECAPDGTDCTSEFGNFTNSPAGSERIRGQVVPFTRYQPLVAPNPSNPGNSNFVAAGKKGVTFTISTGASKVYIYNANNSGLAAYPGPGTKPLGTPLPSTSTGSELTFQTFQPIVWVLTTPGSAS